MVCRQQVRESKSDNPPDLEALMCRLNMTYFIHRYRVSQVRTGAACIQSLPYTVSFEPTVHHGATAEKSERAQKEMRKIKKIINLQLSLRIPNAWLNSQSK